MRSARCWCRKRCASPPHAMPRSRSSTSRDRWAAAGSRSSTWLRGSGRRAAGRLQPRSGSVAAAQRAVACRAGDGFHAVPRVGCMPLASVRYAKLAAMAAPFVQFARHVAADLARGRRLACCGRPAARRTGPRLPRRRLRLARSTPPAPPPSSPPRSRASARWCSAARCNRCRARSCGAATPRTCPARPSSSLPARTRAGWHARNPHRHAQGAAVDPRRRGRHRLLQRSRGIRRARGARGQSCRQARRRLVARPRRAAAGAQCLRDAQRRDASVP